MAQAARRRAGALTPIKDRSAVCVIGLSGVLIAFGNIADAWIGADPLAISWRGGAKAAGVLLIALAACRSGEIRRSELGIRRDGVVKSVIAGGGVALILGSVSLLALRFAPIAGGRVTYSPLQGEAVAPLLFHAVIALPLQTALPEELAFRGVLLALLLRRVSPKRAAAVMSAVFVAWHIVVQAQTLAQTNVTSAVLVVPAAIVAVAGIFAGGLLFAWIRLGTGNLAGAVAAHWFFNAVLVLGLYALTHT